MRRRRAGWALSAAATALAALVLSSCSSAGAANAPDWKPQPAFSGDGGSVPPAQLAPLPGSSGSSTAPSNAAPSSGSSSSGATSGDPNVVATNLTTPDAIAILPDNTALVGERTTGRIVQVQPEPGQPVIPVRTLTGLSTSGGGGLLDLALSPTYGEDGLIFAYISTPTDNRVVDFTLTGPVTPVLTGIPRGPSENTGRLMFGTDGQLYVGTGAAGGTPSATSLAGKILRVDTIGRPSTGNPTAGSAIFASGFDEVDGLCQDATSTSESNPVFETEHRASGGDPVSWVSAGSVQTLHTLTAPGDDPGGCAVDGGELYVTSRDGRELLGAPIRTGTNGGPVLGSFTAYLKGTYGRLLTVVAAPDGALWLTTTNRDGHGTPISTDERVLRIQPPTTTGQSPA